MKLLLNELSAVLLSVFFLAATITARDGVIQADTSSVRQEVAVDSIAGTSVDSTAVPDTKRPKVYKMEKGNKIGLIIASVIFVTVLGLFIYDKAE